MPEPPVTVEIEGHELRLTNLDKVLWPETGFTKGQVIDYLTRVAPVLLPHLRDRPLTRVRYPGGVAHEHFFEKDAPSHTPGWIRTVAVPSGRRGVVRYIVCDDLATLVWLAQLAALELHTLLSRAGDVATPTAVVFDLDPGAPATQHDAARVALATGQLLDDLGLSSFPKVSGGKGVHLYLPLNTPTTFAHTKTFARNLARVLEQHDSAVVTQMRRDLRAGKVFVDWSQNDEHKTTVCAYSLRARPRPTVSAPVTWDEVERCAAGEPLQFGPGEVLDRVERHSDLAAGVLDLRQELPAPLADPGRALQ